MNNKIFYEYLLLLVDAQPDTCEVDRSEIRTQILLATASSVLKGGRSFTHMLTEVRQAGRKGYITDLMQLLMMNMVFMTTVCVWQVLRESPQ